MGDMGKFIEGLNKNEFIEIAYQQNTYLLLQSELKKIKGFGYYFKRNRIISISSLLNNEEKANTLQYLLDNWNEKRLLNIEH